VVAKRRNLGRAVSLAAGFSQVSIKLRQFAWHDGRAVVTQGRQKPPFAVAALEIQRYGAQNDA
jgi:hypothetical protein